MKTSLTRIGVAITLACAMGLAQAQSSSGPGTTSGSGTGTGTVTPSGTLASPGAVVTPGGPTVAPPGVPSGTRPAFGASSPTAPEAGSLSDSINQRNRASADTLGSPTGNGTTPSGVTNGPYSPRVGNGGNVGPAPGTTNLGTPSPSGGGLSGGR